MTRRSPLLSVVMPVHNARAFLDDSIASILDQTLKDFEFVILDDASTDGSGELLRAWARRDDRIRLYTSAERLGLSSSSNFVVSKCTTPTVARMDADDLSHRERFTRQWRVLETRPDVVAVGALCDGIDATGRRVRPRDRWRLIRRSAYPPFPHGSVMFQREAFDAIGGYRPAATGGEDQDLLLRMASRGRVVTLPDVLYHYRYHCDNTTILNCQLAVGQSVRQQSSDLAALYRLGAMQLWAGDRPMILPLLLASGSLRWNPASAIALVSAAWGRLNPASLRAFMRTLIHVRDLLARVRVKDGSPYEWRTDSTKGFRRAPGKLPASRLQ